MREFKVKKTILHLCADIGSDSYYYSQDENYEVIKIGIDIGVENFTPNSNIHGIIANPVCTELSTAKGFHKNNDINKGMFLVSHCLRIIKAAAPKWWVLENPATGRLKDILGRSAYTYQQWEYGSPWTKKTALWGKFNIPEKLYKNWPDVPKNKELYVRPGRGKASLAFLHKSALSNIPEFHKFKNEVKNDADLRSLCSQGFAECFYEINK